MQLFLSATVFIGLIALFKLVPASPIPVQSLTLPTPINDGPGAMDYINVRQTVDLLAIALDQHQYSLLPSIFTSDVVADFGEHQFRGLNAVTQYVQNFKNTVSSHDQTTSRITFDGAGKAHSTCYSIASFYVKGKFFTDNGRYEDDLVRVGQNWKIKTHKFVRWVDVGLASNSTRVVAAF